MSKCVLMFHHREIIRNGNASKVARLPLVILLTTCLVLCVASLSGVYQQIHLTNVILKYYQTGTTTTGIRYDSNNFTDNDGTATTVTTTITSSATSNNCTPISGTTTSMFAVDDAVNDTVKEPPTPLPVSNAAPSSLNLTFLENVNEPSELDETDSPTGTPTAAHEHAPPTYYNLERPKNLRLAIMGDSISRYQYLSLVYFLQTGTWITNATTFPESVSDSAGDYPLPLHCKTPGIPARERFYSLSHSFLQPKELLCDCRAYNENRYFIDTERNNYVTYITKFGKRGTSGRYVPEQVKANRTFEGEAPTKQWTYKYWNQTIHNHIARLQPKPQFLLFNAGLHPHDLHLKNIRKGIIDATKRHGIIPIYKTTTYPNNVSIGFNEFPLTKHDSILCGSKSSDKRTNFPYCIDLSWTSKLYGDDHYYDYYHFKPYWNHYINVQTLLYIQQIQQQHRADSRANANNKNDKTVVPAIFRSQHVEQIVHSDPSRRV